MKRHEKEWIVLAFSCPCILSTQICFLEALPVITISYNLSVSDI